tara:strand:+ start:292 stop:552 length:261 start_codon:yes stop_codon:yes gene_type:complete
MDFITGLGVFAKGVHHMPALMTKFGIVFKLLFLAFGIFWLIMLIHCLKRKFKVPTDKIAWILVFVFLPVIAAFVYLFELKFNFRKK